MSEVKKHYIRALTEFVVSESDSSLPYTSGLQASLKGMPAEKLTALHEECIRVLTASVEVSDAIGYYRRSFIFLIEIMFASRLQEQRAEDGDKLLEDLRFMLLSSERSAQNVKNKYENVLQHMDSGIALFDKEGFISFVNIKFCQLIGAPRRALLGSDIRGLLKSPKLSSSTKRMLTRVYNEMYTYRIPFKEVVDEKGRHLLITANYGEEFDGDILISLKDMTEFKKIEQSAYHNDKLAMLGKIAASIAHEIRNPLTSIRGFIQLMRPDLAALGKEEYGRIILQEIDRANDIINEFLNSSKPSAPMKQKVQVASLVKEISLLYESEALLQGCSIAFGEIDPGITVSVDVKQIKQVLLNIVKNALEELRQLDPSRSGAITITASEMKGLVEISIADNGKGIDEATQSRLFDPFFTTKSDGAGLGLSVSYRIIKNHGGSIEVKSTLNVGTTFTVRLPVESIGGQEAENDWRGVRAGM